ncbi:PAS domain-containing protein [Sphingomonas trueperi]|uniref:PAS domain-containing protein n=1 Tax=Sphingomonas trueperi TaxID=53317 RepID=UPI000EAF3066
MCAKLSVPARNQAKAELRKSRDERMLDSSATAAICAGPDNLIVSWNAGAENLFGFTEFEVLGKPLSLIIPAKHRAAHDARLARAVRAGEARLAGHSVEIIAQHADGREFPVDLSLSMWFEGGQPLFGALLRDVTDRHAAKRRLEHLAHCDTLTALPNRNALYAKLGSAVQRSPRPHRGAHDRSRHPSHHWSGLKCFTLTLPGFGTRSRLSCWSTLSPIPSARSARSAGP